MSIEYSRSIVSQWSHSLDDLQKEMTSKESFDPVSPFTANRISYVGLKDARERITAASSFSFRESKTMAKG